MTKFRCLRNFRFAGHGDFRVGEILELNDAQARELVALGDAVEPVDPKDRKRIVVGEKRIKWKRPADQKPFATDWHR